MLHCNAMANVHLNAESILFYATPSWSLCIHTNTYVCALSVCTKFVLCIDVTVCSTCTCSVCMRKLQTAADAFSQASVARRWRARENMEWNIWCTDWEATMSHALNHSLTLDGVHATTTAAAAIRASAARERGAWTAVTRRASAPGLS